MTYTSDADYLTTEMIKAFNKDRDHYLFSEYNHIFNYMYENIDNVYLCRVKWKRHSNLLDKEVMPLADIYAVYVDADITELMQKYDFYLDEDIILKYRLPIYRISRSGISVRMFYSKSPLVIRFTPDTFKKVFSFSEIGAGASLYYRLQRDVKKNKEVIAGWKTTPARMSAYFRYQDPKENFLNDINICREMKDSAEGEINFQLTRNMHTRSMVFNGVGVFEEPFTAFHVLKEGRLVRLDYMPYKLSTGTGRSKNIFVLNIVPIVDKSIRYKIIRPE